MRGVGMGGAASLQGKLVACLEARMASEMAALVRRHGGTPLSAPVLQEVYLKDSPPVRALIQDICSGQVDVVVLLTGVGTRALMEAAAAMGREAELVGSLNQRTIIARSPKPARVLRQYQVHIDLMPPEPYTSQELVAAMGEMELRDRQVAVQRYGEPNPFLVRSLEQRGARVREVTLYRWGLPEDKGPVLGLVDRLARGQVDAVAFTSQPQVDNLLAIAGEAGKEVALRDSLNGPVVVASVGPVCSRRLREHGIKVDVEPVHVHMGNLVTALADYLSARAGAGR